MHVQSVKNYYFSLSNKQNCDVLVAVAQILPLKFTLKDTSN